MIARGGQRTFEVLAWLTERHVVLYVPEIEAATSVPAPSPAARVAAAREAPSVATAGRTPEAEDAVRSLIADLTGLDAAAIRFDIAPVRGHRGPGRDFRARP